jgi:exopolysaccharide biosynthesis polyprenyl glycosylphosphotransferase
MLRIFSFRIVKWKLMLCAGDLVCYCLSVLAGLFFTSPDTIMATITLNKISFLLMGFIYLLVFLIADLYDHQSDYFQTVKLLQVFFSCWIGIGVVVLVFYFPAGTFIGRAFLIIQAVAFSVLMVTWRVTFSATLAQRLQKRILIIGAGNAGQRLLKAIKARPRFGILPVGFVDDDSQKAGTTVGGLPVLGDSCRCEELVKKHQVSLAVVAITHDKSPKLIDTLIKMSWNSCQLMDMPTFYEYLTGKLPTAHISDSWFFQWNLNNTKLYYQHLKRLMDLSLAIIGLALSWPLFALITLLIKIDSGGPVFYQQERIGQGGKPFNILKFRTMIKNADSCGPHWTSNNDPRVTRVGRFLRKLRFDELPQLINILKGEMSIVGPRPLVHCSFKKTIPYFNYRLLVKPGITGWAQVMYPDGLNLETTPEKLKYDLYYIKNIGFLLDLVILLKTVRIVLFGRGI